MRELSDRGRRVSVAESCTGGLVAALLTDVEGYSHAFDRGFVSYTDGAKHALLDVSTQTLERHGAVSPEAAEEMAAGALANSTSDVALSITGFAGKAGPDDEVGLVYFGLARKSRPCLVEERHFGDLGRSGIRIEAVRTGVELLLRSLST
jgi:nicotinamide-nucleotide amidase